jgi:hypothetical protein
MIQSDELKSGAPLRWSTGRGTDVWAMFCAFVARDLSAVERLVSNDPKLVCCKRQWLSYFCLTASPNLADDPPWATPLAWATRRGHTEIADLL